MLPIHGNGHRDSAVHGSYHLVVGGFKQADVVSAIIIAEKKKDVPGSLGDYVLR